MALQAHGPPKAVPLVRESVLDLKKECETCVQLLADVLLHADSNTQLTAPSPQNTDISGELYLQLKNKRSVVIATIESALRDGEEVSECLDIIYIYIPYMCVIW
jgi:hypothetical protein